MRIITALGLFVFCVPALAQPPTLPESSAPPQTPDQIESPDQIEAPNQVIADHIRDALETGKPAAAPGILGDVLEVIRQRGSILDGSVLDPKAEDPLKIGESATQETNHYVEPAVQSPEHANANVAETLLRSARLLESIPGGDEERAALVRQMRIQATRLLVQMYPL